MDENGYYVFVVDNCNGLNFVLNRIGKNSRSFKLMSQFWSIPMWWSWYFQRKTLNTPPPLSSIQHIEKAYFWSNVVPSCSVCSLPPPLFQKNKNMFDKIFIVIMFFCHLLEFELRILGRPMEISMASFLFSFQYNNVFLKILIFFSVKQ